MASWVAGAYEDTLLAHYCRICQFFLVSRFAPLRSLMWLCRTVASWSAGVALERSAWVSSTAACPHPVLDAKVPCFPVSCPLTWLRSRDLPVCRGWKRIAGCCLCRLLLGP